MVGFFKALLRNNSGQKSTYVKRELSSIKKNIMSSFKRFKADMDKQSQWINHLHSSHKNLNSLHEGHKEIHAKDIEHLHSLISNLHTNHRHNEETLRRLEDSVRSSFQSYNKYLIDIYRIVHGLKEEMKDHYEKHEKEDAKKVETLVSLDGGVNKHNHTINNGSNLITSGTYEAGSANKLAEQRISGSYVRETELSQEEPYTSLEISNIASDKAESSDKGPLMNMSDKLTRAEKKLIAHLIKSDQKLSYKDLSMLCNISVNTVKNHICNIKNKDFPLKEYSDDGNIKRYFVPENMKQILLSKRF
ncbi:MAG: helix-turn-helix transcriptional regulator [Candidatus Woesearchaeota archaeon]